MSKTCALLDSEIQAALTALNWSYGKGEVSYLRFTEIWPDKGITKGVFYRRIFYTQNYFRIEYRRFTVQHRTVKALGHQLTVK